MFDLLIEVGSNFLRTHSNRKCFESSSFSIHHQSSQNRSYHTFFQASGDYLCPRCNLPLCSDECSSDSSDHFRFECKIFSSEANKSLKSRRLEIKSYDFDHPLYQCITPLRCLMLKESMPQRWRAIQVGKRRIKLSSRNA